MLQLNLDNRTEAPRLSPRQRAAEKAAKRAARLARIEEARIERRQRFKRKNHYEVKVATPAELHFRHSCWQAKREQVYNQLQNAGIAVSSLSCFANCGAAVVVYYSPAEGRHLLKASYCHSRHCEPCMRAKAANIARNIRQKLEENPDRRYTFETYTLRHTDRPLDEQIKKLYRCFKELRATDLWKYGPVLAAELAGEKDAAARAGRKPRSRRQILGEHPHRGHIGGTLSLEVKWNEHPTEHCPIPRCWHPHLHVIAEAYYVDKRDLCNEWKRITGDSFIVDIRLLRDKKETAFYVSKYVAKGTSNEVWNDKDAAQEWISASRSIRTCATWGTWRGLKLTESRPWPADAKPVASYDQIIAAARKCEEWAIGVLQDIMPTVDPQEVRETFVMNTGDG